MKKRLVAIVSIIMCFLMSISVFSGCNLITNNTERDLEQVVATVNIGEGFETEKIYKKDMVMAYMNYGYSYAQTYDQAQLFNMIIDTLINNRLLVQHAMKYMEEEGLVEDEDATIYTLNRYLTDKEIEDATYETIKSINDVIDSYEEEEEKSKFDSYAGEVRTAPTDAKKFEKEIEKDTYNEAGVLKGTTGDDRNVAYNKVLKVLKTNGLLGENVTDIEQSSYYNDVLKGQKETALIEKYENILKAKEREAVEFGDLETKYEQMYEDQKSSYDGNDEAFSSALSSATAKSPIMYNGANGSYGYVYNLLLGVTPEQDTAIKAIDKKNLTKDDYNKERNEILQATLVQDLRSSWIYAGYDFDGEYFTGDYTFITDVNETTNPSLAFQGTAVKVKDATDDESAVYRVEKLDQFGLNSFVTFMEKYLYGSTQQGTDRTNPASATYRTVNVGDVVDNKFYDQRINELLFAFSTDKGSLNTYKGYVIEPQPELDESDDWVIEFANAGRTLMGMGNQSYVIVASDYGYHVLFYSEVVSANSNYETLTAYLNSLEGTKDWADEYGKLLVEMAKDDFEEDDYKDDYLYNFALSCANVDSKVNTIEQNLIKAYKYDGKSVVKFEKAYADLLGK